MKNKKTVKMVGSQSNILWRTVEQDNVCRRQEERERVNKSFYYFSPQKN